MNKNLLLLPFAGLLLVSGTALAGETMSGVVARADPNSGELTIVGGGTVQVTQPLLLRNLAPGEHVIITQNNNGTIGVQEDSSYAGAGDY